MTAHVHHVHLFSSDIDKSVAFYRDFFGGDVVLDMDLVGARNVFMKVGRGRIHFYDQPPKDAFRGPVHHIGMQVEGLGSLVAKMKAGGVVFRKPVSDFGIWKYVMAPAPDGVLLELFEVDRTQIPEDLADYFEAV